MQTIHTPRLTQINKILIISGVIVFLLSKIMEKTSGSSLIPVLGLSHSGFFQGMIHQILTWPLIGRELFEVIFNSLLLWFIGSELESLWGLRRYLGFILSVVLGTTLVYLLISLLFFPNTPYALTGMAGIIDASLLAYAILFPTRVFQFMLIIPIQAKYFCLIIISIQLYLGFFSSAAVLAWGQLASMMVGVIWMFLISSPSFKKSLFQFTKTKRQRDHLKLVKKDQGPTFH